MRRAALLEDPHRVGVRIRLHLLHLEELGDIVRQLRCPVAGIRNEGPATDCEHPGRERRDQAQTQNEPRHACDKLDARREDAWVDGHYRRCASGAAERIVADGTLAESSGGRQTALPRPRSILRCWCRGIPRQNGAIESAGVGVRSAKSWAGCSRGAGDGGRPEHLQGGAVIRRRHRGRSRVQCGSAASRSLPAASKSSTRSAVK